MILVDTSVWIDHLRHGNHLLSTLLERNRVLMHSMIIGELACGSLKDRQVLLDLWGNLPAIPVVSDPEALYYLEHHQLMGKGIGYVDLHLLASAAVSTAAALWTNDKRLCRVANDLHVAFSDALQ